MRTIFLLKKRIKKLQMALFRKISSSGKKMQKNPIFQNLFRIVSNLCIRNNCYT